jgi:mono/diheme cytochrome c family protein
VSRAGLLAAGAAVVATVATVVGWQTQDAPAASEVRVAADGAALFQVKGCASCHVGPDSRPFIDNFPNLSNAPAWAGERREGMSAEDYIAESIRSPSAFISPDFVDGGPTEGMPDLRLTEEEITALVDYLLDA